MSTVCEQVMPTSSFDQAEFRQYMLTPVRISKRQLGAFAKTYALSWQTWLSFGPSLASMRSALQDVVSITSEMGSERLVARCADFFTAHGVTVPVREKLPTSHLFPYAVVRPGWGHYCDLMVKSGLSALPWFPRWLAKAKSLLSVLRDHQVEIKDDLEDAGKGHIYPSLNPSRLPTFAHWRWGTLCQICQLILPMFSLIVEVPCHFKFLRSLRD